MVFLDDDVVIQRDLLPLWEIDLEGKVNGAVETCKGEDGWVMSKRFKTYFNFSHPLIIKNLDADECAWAFGMNIFDLAAWRKTNIRRTYHYWIKEVLLNSLAISSILLNFMQIGNFSCATWMHFQCLPPKFRINFFLLNDQKYAPGILGFFLIDMK